MLDVQFTEIMHVGLLEEIGGDYVVVLSGLLSQYKLQAVSVLSYMHLPCVLLSPLSSCKCVVLEPRQNYSFGKCVKLCLGKSL